MHHDPWRGTPAMQPVRARRFRHGRWLPVAVTTLTLLSPLPLTRPVIAAPSVTIQASVPAGRPVGSTITWTARAGGMQTAVYRFSVAPAGSPLRVVRDFSQHSSFTWMPMQEGTYTVEVAVKDGFTATSAADQSATYTVSSRVTGTRAVISPTANPLVLLYSAPACGAGTLAVQFRPADGSGPWLTTAVQPCQGSKSVNVLVAGMRAHTTYALRAVTTSGASSTTSPSQTVTTGVLPAKLQMPTFKVSMAATAQADQSTPFIFDALIPVQSPVQANPVMTDLQGNIVWFYNTLQSGLTTIWPVRMMPDGTALILGKDQYAPRGDDVLREVNLAGVTIRETNTHVVDAQLAQRGQEPIYSFHHDALALPNGDLAVLGDTQKMIDGHDVMSDMVVVLDPNLQVVWSWDFFAHFTPPVTFPAATLNCLGSGGLFLCGLPDPKSIDWTHGNALSWSPGDNNLVVSFREISQVIKIDYRNGQGSGKVLWVLGKEGNFTPVSTDPSPWFSGQHNANFINPTTMIVFDDGLVRCQAGKVKGCDSRGQEWTINTQNHTATLKFNADLGQFWVALGSAQLLPNGDLAFAGGYAPPSKEFEFRPDGTKVYQLDSPLAVYRAFRFGAL